MTATGSLPFESLITARDQRIYEQAAGDPHEMVAVIVRRRGGVFPAPLNHAARDRIEREWPIVLLGCKMVVRYFRALAELPT